MTAAIETQLLQPLGITRQCKCLSTGGPANAADAAPFQPGNGDIAVGGGGAAALQHFEQGRQLQWLGASSGGASKTTTSYAEHYPPKELPHQHSPQAAPGDAVVGAPFRACSEYTRAFDEKRRLAPPLEQQQQQTDSHVAFQPHRARPSISNETTNRAHFQPWELPAVQQQQRQRSAARAPLADLTGDTYLTTHAAEFVPKSSSTVRPHGITVAQPLSRSEVTLTSYDDHFRPKPVPQLVRRLGQAPPLTLPLDSRTTYGVHFVPKALPGNVVPLTGMMGGPGMRLPQPRQSLGVEILGGEVFTLLPFSLCTPCSARQIFTTVHDNQSEACINVLYGMAGKASDPSMRIVAQFDITSIPAAPKGVPQIEVTFRLDRRNILTVEGRDLDTGRHQQWQQHGRIAFRQ